MTVGTTTTLTVKELVFEILYWRMPLSAAVVITHCIELSPATSAGFVKVENVATDATGSVAPQPVERIWFAGSAAKPVSFTVVVVVDAGGEDDPHALRATVEMAAPAATRARHRTEEKRKRRGSIRSDGIGVTGKGQRPSLGREEISPIVRGSSVREREPTLAAQSEEKSGAGRMASLRGRETLSQKLASRQPEFRYGETLLLLFITFFFIGSAPSAKWVAFVTVLIESVTLLVVLTASGAHRILYTVSLIAIFCGVVSSGAALFMTSHAVAASSAVLNAFLVFVAPAVIIRGIAARRVVDVRTVLAALCLYVMMGLFFSTVYGALEAASHHAFFVQVQDAHAQDFLYFSFITITTVGYGDLTAARGFGRTLAAFEAMVGQFYLVTVVALLVSNMGPLFSGKKKAEVNPSEDDEGSVA